MLQIQKRMIGTVKSVIVDDTEDALYLVQKYKNVTESGILDLLKPKLKEIVD